MGGATVHPGRGRGRAAVAAKESQGALLQLSVEGAVRQAHRRGAGGAEFTQRTELGGKRYPFDSVPTTKHDWQRHYQPAWGRLDSAKRTYDPDGILTPGQGIF